MPGVRIHWHAPEIHAAAAITDEVDCGAVRRPRRTPIDVRIVGDRPGLATRRGDDEDVADAGESPVFGAMQSPEDDEASVRRPGRLEGVVRREIPHLAGIDAHDL